MPEKNVRFGEFELDFGRFQLNRGGQPVRLEGLDKVLHPSWKMARPGRVRVAFGAPMHLSGENYEALARQVEEAVKNL